MLGSSQSMDVKAYDGKTMPIHGYGTWQAAPGQVETGVEVAIDAGYRLIDTAMGYGNEAEIGAAVHRKIAEGKITREDVFITTKNWVTFFARDKVTASLKGSLDRLKMDYVDLYLLHAPCAMEMDPSGGRGFKTGADGRNVPAKVDLADSWKGMEDVYKAGLAKQIGISNFNETQVRYICENASVQPHNHQLELHIYFPQKEMRALCAEKGITVTSYATLGSPGRVNLKIPGLTINWPNPGVALEDPNVVGIAKAHGKTPAQVLLRWAMQHNIAVIPKSVTPSRIRENVGVFDFELSKDEMAKLDNPGIHQRLFLQEWAIGHPEDPFKNERD